MSQVSWIDRTIDAIRSPRTAFLLAGVFVGWLVFSPATQPNIMYVTFHNQDDVVINSVRLEFGFDLNQSNLLVLQIKPQESRTIALNHVPGRGFNVEAHYADGQIQHFCANKGVTEQRQNVVLQR